MSRFGYLAYLVIGLAALLAECGRMRIVDRRLLRALLVTMPIFLGFDALGAARGWFYTEPALNVLVLPGGISIEEVINLALLTLFAVTLSLGFRRLDHA